MRTLKYIGIFLGGFVCAFLLWGFVLSPRDYWNGYHDGREFGIDDGHREAAQMIQKEFGTYDANKPFKLLFEADASSVVSIETNGVKTIRVIP
jgi:hypothetical protein